VKRLIFPLLLLGLVLPLLMQVAPLEILKLKTFDALVTEQEPSGYFVTIDLDEEFIEQEGGWPLPRQRLAEIHIDLLRAGALGIGYALTFPQADRMGGDLKFAEALSFSPSVLAMFENDNGSYPPVVGTVILGNDQGGGYLARGVVENIDLLKNKSSQGIASAPTDVDGLVRQIPLLLRTPEGFAPSFALEILKILANQETYIIKMNENGMEEVTVRSIPPIEVDALGRKWVSYVNTPTTDLLDPQVKDKFVIIGTSGGGIMPQVPTSQGLKYPHHVQAALAESILLENSPRIPNWHLGAELGIFLIFVSCIWLLTSKLSMTLGLVLTISGLSLLSLLGVWFIQAGILLDITWTLIASFITGSTSYYLKFREQYKLRQQIKKQFGTYLSPDMVQMLQDDPSLLKLGGVRKDMTFLFMDIVGFTPISEAFKKNDDPEGLVDLINDFLDRMTVILLDHGATIDKYMGDCIMAFWNAPLECKDHARQAVLAAKAIEEEAALVNQEYIAKGLPSIKVGTGVNTGTCIVGNMGSKNRFDYSVIGDAVNLGARLEGQTRNYDCDTLFSEFTIAPVIDIDFKLMDIIQVKGKEEKVKIYTFK
jgi:adenylate cyclase